MSTLEDVSTHTYAGDIVSRAAWHTLRDDPDAVLLDVRTVPEWQYVGVPDLTDIGKEPVFVSWQVYPAMTRNADFVADVRAAGVPQDANVLVLCRSGSRSRAAAVALTEAGYVRCFNIADGFEGGLDAHQRRGRAEGWRAAGLPWVQS